MCEINQRDFFCSNILQNIENIIQGRASGLIDHLDHLDHLNHLDYLDHINHLDHMDHPAHLDNPDSTVHYSSLQPSTAQYSPVQSGASQ